METPTDAAPQTPKNRTRRRTLLATALAALVVAGSIVTYLAVATTAETASPDAFRFDAVYIAPKTPDQANQTGLTVDMWFTNIERPDLRNVKIIAIAIEVERNVQVSKSEHQVGAMDGRQTRNAGIDLNLNMSRPHRIDLLVLVDGLLVARGQGDVGSLHRLYLDHEVQMSEAATLAGDFRIEYRNQI